MDRGARLGSNWVPTLSCIILYASVEEKAFLHTRSDTNAELPACQRYAYNAGKNERRTCAVDAHCSLVVLALGTYRTTPYSSRRLIDIAHGLPFRSDCASRLFRCTNERKSSSAS